ncbi:MAG: hypothetical protein FJ191_05125 [Gammaproteobacteria bacterium]|nr:hypothetical protein [Gammaproteobacteria bacterium]
MRILLDQGTPAPLRLYLRPHEVATTFELGWSGLSNGDLLARIEAPAFDVLVTTDQNLRYQQDLRNRRVAIVVILTTSWPRIQRAVEDVIRAVDSARPGEYCEAPIPA